MFAELMLLAERLAEQLRAHLRVQRSTDVNAGALLDEFEKFRERVKSEGSEEP